jgi:hypothetical protein
MRDVVPVNATGPSHTAPSDPDGDGVRYVGETRPVPRAAIVSLLVGTAIALALAWVLLRDPAPKAAGAGATQGEAAEPTDVVIERPPPRATRNITARAPRAPTDDEPIEAAQGPDDLPSTDPDDIASYISPDDPEPTMAEVIEALQASGDHTGLGAFNPPGTSPPLPGLAVPEDFVLPEGYVRHHQVTDAGEPLEPILMFSPDYVFRDEAGREIAIPEDRVVPPELAPPGLPIRPITIPRDE